MKKSDILGLITTMAMMSANNGNGLVPPKQPTKHIQVTKNGKRIVTYKYE